MPPAPGLNPVDKRKKLGKIVKELGRDPANFNITIEGLVNDNVITNSQADAFRDMLAEANAQTDFSDKAEYFNRLGRALNSEVAYIVGETLAKVDPTDPEAISVRRDVYVSAGLKWLSRNMPTL